MVKPTLNHTPFDPADRQEDQAQFPWALPKNLWPKEASAGASAFAQVEKKAGLEVDCEDGFLLFGLIL